MKRLGEIAMLVSVLLLFSIPQNANADSKKLLQDSWGKFFQGTPKAADTFLYERELQAKAKPDGCFYGLGSETFKYPGDLTAAEISICIAGSGEPKVIRRMSGVWPNPGTISGLEPSPIRFAWLWVLSTAPFRLFHPWKTSHGYVKWERTEFPISNLPGSFRTI